MFCSACGTQNDARNQTCTQCGAPLQAQQAQPPAPAWGQPPQAPAAYGQPAAAPGSVPNYLVQAILVTLFCCLPFGIVSIVYAAQVNGKLAAGDVAGARASSGNAKRWAWISFGVGLVVGLGYIVVMVLAGLSSGLSR